MRKEKDDLAGARDMLLDDLLQFSQRRFEVVCVFDAYGKRAPTPGSYIAAADSVQDYHGITVVYTASSADIGTPSADTMESICTVPPTDTVPSGSSLQLADHGQGQTMKKVRSPTALKSKWDKLGLGALPRPSGGSGVVGGHRGSIFAQRGIAPQTGTGGS